MKTAILKFATLISVFTIASAQIPTTSLVAHWNFSSNANDVTGNGNHGTVYNATLTCDRCNNPNSAYGFNGINAMIQIPNSSWIDMNNSQDFTICYWLKTYQNPNMNAAIMSKNVHGYWSGYMFFSNNTVDPGYCQTPGNLWFYTAAGWQQDACANGPVCTGSLDPGQTEDACNTGWKFICGMYDAATSSSTLYIDGIAQADIGGISGALSSTCNLFIGAHTTYTYYFKGALDDIRIYKRKLDQTEINALYHEDCSQTTAGLRSYGNDATSIYPNPVNSNLFINSDLAIKSIRVSEINGKEIKVFYDPGSSIDLQGLAKGFYILRIQTDKGVKITKLMKE